MEQNNFSLEEIGARAKQASREMNRLGVMAKNHGLEAVAEALLANQDKMILANKEDVKTARENGIKESLIDRLTLTPERIAGMAEGIRQIIALEDPIGEVISMKTTPLGMQIGQKRVPLGVIGIIYESRPNVTADAFGLCFKTGNAVILRGGKDALASNQAIVEVIREALMQCKLPADSIQLLTDTSHETAERFMRLNQYVDVLIPRGGAGLIRTVVEKSTVPVIETGTGNCHVYVDAAADVEMAVDIIENAKTQRLGVCNACESLVIHSKIADEALPLICERLAEHSVEIRGDKRACAIWENMIEAAEEDFGTEYLDAIISVKIVDSLEDAIEHINTYNTGHSEAIVTADYNNAMRFLNEVDAAAVYVNASTRFTDGFEFGFGAEIGISTQKLHARGPMGLLALTTTKYIILGNGQIRK
ncbi:MAG: glutamate-5-semialdehyde dehydrogenase [Lachnospiraceae bacterium]|nr:glutamate-5-semialdehyde dehydrogenase [Lachnospiraceae bacterium]